MTDIWTCVGVVLCVAVLWVMFRWLVAVTLMDIKVLRIVSAFWAYLTDSNKCQCPMSEEEDRLTSPYETLNCPKKPFSSVNVTNSLLKKEHERYRKRRGKMTDVKSDDSNTEKKVTRTDDKLEDSAGVTRADTGHNENLPDTGLFITYHDNTGKQRLNKIKITESQRKKFADSRIRRKKWDGAL